MKTFWRILPIALVAAIAFFSLTGPGDEPIDNDDASQTEDSGRATTTRPRRYRAEWIVNAGPAGREEPGAPYVYVEVIDDPNGQTLVQSSTHLAIQDLEYSAICAAIFAGEEQRSCARIERPEGVPNVASIAVTAIRDWSPAGVFEAAGLPSLRAAEARDPDAWTSTLESHRGVPVECFKVLRDTPVAPTGFDICYTNDGNALIASLDLTGDEILEVDLQLYSSDVSEDSFDLGFEMPIDPTIYEQLVFIHPQVPVGSDDLDDPADESS